jgi:hypothetical protein
MKGARNKVVTRLSVFILCILLSIAAMSQSNFETVNQNSIIVEKKYDFTFDKTLFPPSDSFMIKVSGSNISFKNSETLSIVNPLMKRALFCRLEDQVSKKSNIAMRMRLGSLDYVNQIEQKPNYRINSKN